MQAKWADENAWRISMPGGPAKYPGVTWLCFTCRNDRSPGTGCTKQTVTVAMFAKLPAVAVQCSCRPIGLKLRLATDLDLT